MERLGNKTYFVDLDEPVALGVIEVPEHLQLMPIEKPTDKQVVGFKVQADRAYIAEYGMRFYRQGIVFLIIPHAAYRSVRLIECDELLQKMEAGPAEEEVEIPHNGD